MRREEPEKGGGRRKAREEGLDFQMLFSFFRTETFIPPKGCLRVYLSFLNADLTTVLTLTAIWALIFNYFLNVT